MDPFENPIDSPPNPPPPRSRSQPQRNKSKHALIHEYVKSARERTSLDQGPRPMPSNQSPRIGGSSEAASSQPAHSVGRRSEDSSQSQWPLTSQPPQGLGLSNTDIPPIPPTPSRLQTDLPQSRQRIQPRQTASPSSPAYRPRPIQDEFAPPAPILSSPYYNSSGRSSPQMRPRQPPPNFRQPPKSQIPTPRQPSSSNFRQPLPPESRQQQWRPNMNQGTAQNQYRRGPPQRAPPPPRPSQAYRQPPPSTRRPYIPPSNFHDSTSSSVPMEMSTVPALQPVIVTAPSVASHQAVAPTVSDIEEESEPRDSLKPSLSSVLFGADVLSEYYETSDDEHPKTKAKSGPDSLRPDAGLVGQARLGQRQKPTLTLIRSSVSDTTAHEHPITTLDKSPQIDQANTDLSDIDMIHEGLMVPAPLSPRLPRSPVIASSTSFPLLSHDGSYAESAPIITSRQSAKSAKSAKILQSPVAETPKSPLPPVESRFRQSARTSLDHPEAPASGLLEQPVSLVGPSDTSNTSSRVVECGSQLISDSDIPRDVGVRASTTSLPGLITRALRLASNLERGKTSSKFGLDWMTSIPEPQAGETKRKSGASITELMEAFPDTPASPHPERGQVPLSAWPKGSGVHTALRHSQHGMSSLPSTPSRSVSKPRRRCCFMPLWLFILVLVLLIVLIAAAIIIPMVVIVIPNQKHTSTASVASCQTSTPCSNGGSSVVSTAGACQCLCINGWDGATCTVQDTSGCLSDLTNGANSTLGSSIPRLITLSQASFQTTLNQTLLLAAFSAVQLSCASQNALVTFNGLASRSIHDPPARIQRRQITRSSNGIIFASSTVSFVSASTPTGTSTTDASSAIATFSPSSQTSLDFGRTAVLFVLQSTSNLTTAITAQTDLQAFFTTPGSTNPSSLIIGNGWTADFISTSVSQPGA